MRTQLKRLRELREAKGLTQLQLAEKTGLTGGTIGNFESGRKAPSVKTLCRLADTLWVTIDCLLGRENNLDTSDPILRRILRNCEKMNKTDLEIFAGISNIFADKYTPRDKVRRKLSRRDWKEAWEKGNINPDDFTSSDWD